MGAKQVGFVQILLTTCRLHGTNPFICVVDVLQLPTCATRSPNCLTKAACVEDYEALLPYRIDPVVLTRHTA